MNTRQHSTETGKRAYSGPSWAQGVEKENVQMRSPTALAARRGRSIQPCLRTALLVHFKPKLTHRNANRILDWIMGSWDSRVEDLRATLQHVAENKFPLQILGEESVRKRQEDQTLVLDCPRITTSEGERFQFDNRVCLALCLESLSSKVWSRVGMPLGRSHSQPAAFREPEDVIAAFHRINDAAMSWLADLLDEAVRDDAPEYKIQRGIRLEVVALGVKDEPLKHILESIEDESLQIEDVLDDRAAREALRFYLKKVGGVRGGLRVGNKLSADTHWLPSYAVVEIDGGFLVPREVLYFIEQSDDSTRAVGVGYDDSKLGELAHRSALVIAKRLAKES